MGIETEGLATGFARVINTLSAIGEPVRPGLTSLRYYRRTCSPRRQSDPYLLIRMTNVTEVPTNDIYRKMNTQ